MKNVRDPEFRHFHELRKSLENGRDPWPYLDTTQDPVALFVNFESRDIALKHFTRFSGDILNCPYRNHEDWTQQIYSAQYIDYSNDIAAFEWQVAREFVEPSLPDFTKTLEWNKLTGIIITDFPHLLRGRPFGSPEQNMTFLRWLLGLHCLRELTIEFNLWYGSRNKKPHNVTLMLETGQTIKMYGTPDVIERYVRVFKVELNETGKRIAATQLERSMAL